MQMITPRKKQAPELKELSPLPSLLLSQHHLHRTSKLEILKSPASPNCDLFHQLITVEHPLSPKSPEHYMDLSFQIMEEEYSEEGFSRSDDAEREEEDDDVSSQDDDGVRKRKRKSTAQIKMLKAELNVEPNWSKEKIVEMSEVTGLSQSQVYKWWWDQKKKSVKEQKHNLEKRKFIKKEVKKGVPYDKQSQGYYLDQSLLTKPKTSIDIEQVPATERKINKRLVFF